MRHMHTAHTPRLSLLFLVSSFQSPLQMCHDISAGTTFFLAFLFNFHYALFNNRQRFGQLTTRSFRRPIHRSFQLALPAKGLQHTLFGQSPDRSGYPGPFFSTQRPANGSRQVRSLHQFRQNTDYKAGIFFSMWKMRIPVSTCTLASSVNPKY